MGEREKAILSLQEALNIARSTSSEIVARPIEERIEQYKRN
jgi:hypothetical protein